jgi:hypothetical protein
MITPYKILPIHASYKSNGKICTLNEKLRRTHSALSKHHENLTPGKNREEPIIHKPKTAHLINRTQGLHLEVPTKQVIEIPACITERITEKYKASNRSSSY